MKITKLSIFNYLGLTAFKLDKVGKLNRLTGDNGVGKTTVLKAITEAFRSSGVDPHLIHLNEERAEIMVEIDHRVLVERRITQSANNVKVTIDGQPVNSPQKFLAGLVGQYIFNPVDFFMASARERRNQFLQAIPLTLTKADLSAGMGDRTPEDFDFLVAGGFLAGVGSDEHGLSALETIKTRIYEARHEAGLNVTRLEKAIEQDKRDIPEAINAEEWRGFDLNSAMQTMQDAEQKIREHQRRESDLQAMRTRDVQITDEIKALEERIAALTAEQQNIRAKGKPLAAEVAAFVAPNVDGIRDQVKRYDAFRKVQVRVEAMLGRQNELVEVQEHHVTLDRVYKKLVDGVPKAMLARLELPLEHVEIRGDDIYVAGVASQNLSTAEQMQFSLLIAKWLAKELKVICIDRYESLGQAAREALMAQADKDEFEYFVTDVTSGPLAVEVKDPAPIARDAEAKPATAASPAKSRASKPLSRGGTSLCDVNTETNRAGF